jgi:hypothetical protein
MEIVIDTSAILAVRLTRGSTLVAPSSVHWEIGNAISAMFKRKSIELDDALRVLDAYAGIPIRLLDQTLRQATRLCWKKQKETARFFACHLPQSPNHRPWTCPG